jgi:hypothetical protein
VSIKKTLGVLVLFLLGLGYIIYVEIPKDEKQAEAQKLFGTLTSERIAEVTINRKGESFTLKNSAYSSEATPSRSNSAKDDGGDSQGGMSASWLFNGIEGAGLDSAALTSLTSALADLKAGEPLPKEDVEGNLAVYGLADPELTVKVAGRLGDGEEFRRELRFGKTNEFVRQRYVEVREVKDSATETTSSDATSASGGAIYLMSEALFSAANRPGKDFRDKSVVSFVDGDVVSFRVGTADSEVVVERVTEGTGLEAVVRRSPWKVVSSEIGEIVPASEEEVATVFRELRNTRASDFIDGVSAEGLSSFGFQADSPTLVVNFKDTAATPLSLRFHRVEQKDAHGRGPGAYVAKGNSALVFVTPDPTERLFRSGEALRDRAMFRIPTHRLKEMIINRMDGEKITLQKSEAGIWSLAPSQGELEAGLQVADAAFVDELISNLTRIKAVSFPKDSRDFGLSPARASVQVILSGGAGDGGQTHAPTAILNIGSQVSESANSDYYAAVTELGEDKPHGVVFTLGADEVAKILPSRETLAPVPTSTPTPAPSETNQN